jgi:hypothetical protein
VFAGHLVDIPGTITSSEQWRISNFRPPLEVQIAALLMPILFAAHTRKLSVYFIWLVAAGLAFASLSLPSDRIFPYAPCFRPGIVACRLMGAAAQGRQDALHDGARRARRFG